MSYLIDKYYGFVVAKNVLLAALFIVPITAIFSQCEIEVTVNYVSLNLAAGCDFNDTNGPDPTILMADLNGNNILCSEIKDFIQASGPVQNEPINASNSSGCSAPTIFLGTYPLGTQNLTYNIEIFEKDGTCCTPYFAFGPFGDSDYASGQHNFNLQQISGTVDVGSCISFNYELQIDTVGNIGSFITGDYCYNHIEIIDGIEYSIDNPLSQINLGPISNQGCDSIVTVFLNFYEEPALTITAPSGICINSYAQLSVDQDYPSYMWSTNETTQEIEIFDDEEYSVTITDNNGCTKDTSIRINFYPQNELIISGPDSICDPLIDQTPIFLNATTGFETYTWSDGGDDSQLEIFNSGNYTLTATDINQCSYQQEFTVNTYLTPDLFIEGNETICAGGSTSLEIIGDFESLIWNTQQNTSVIEVGEPGEYIVEVIDQNGCQNTQSIIIVEAPVIEITTNLFTCDPNEVTSVTDTYTDENGCQVIETISIAIYTDGSCDMDVEITTQSQLCGANGSMSFEITEGQGPFTYEIYNENDDLISEESLTEFSAGNYIIIFENEFGATLETSFAIEEIPLLEYEVLNQYQGVIGDSIFLSINVDTSQIQSINWQNLGNASCQKCVAVEYFISETQAEIMVEIIDNNNCVYQESISIIGAFDAIEENFFVPNIMYVNAPSENQSFFISGEQLLPESNFSIYDRWGNLIYTSSNISDSWNGEFNGNSVQPNVYVYCANLKWIDGRSTIKCGDITVIDY